jgi:diadenylate cyclase
MWDDFRTIFTDWRAITQILLIAAFMYLVLRFIRGTRGAGVFRGLVVLWIILYVTASFLTKWAEWEQIGFLVENVLTVGIFAVLIIFQPELRRGLVRLGRNPFLPRSKRTRVFEQLTRAVDTLSQRRIGALIAIEREVGLGGLVEGGTHLDAELSSDLLHTIFWPGTPLHDGAAIVHGDRIVAAGCVLPLTDNPALARRLGTRHRAAVGLSEETDAVVLIVSEETGNISVSLSGQIIENITPRELMRQLATAFPQESGEKPKKEMA